MRKVDIVKFRKEVMSIIEANRKNIISVKYAHDYSVLTFSGKKYMCEVTLTEKWIGYDLEITTPDGMHGCGLVGGTDLYPIFGGKNEEVALKIYDELIKTIKAIFAGKVYYTSNKKFSYTATQNNDSSYKVKYWESKSFLFLPYSSGWVDEAYPANDFKKLQLTKLS